MKDRLRVLIVGGGFGGLRCVRALRRAPVDVTLVDRRNFHLFQPLLYQVATGGLSPANIAAPLRAILRRQANARVLLGEVVDVDLSRRVVVLAEGGRLPYDTLVVASGMRHAYFGHPEWEALAPGLKGLEDATEIRRRVLVAFEAAERVGPGAAASAHLTFVVVGGGPTGVELAGALAEIARHTLRRDFRAIDPTSARIVLIEGGERVLSTFPPTLSEKALGFLVRLGVEVRTQAMVRDVQPEGVTLETGGRTERLAARTVLWAAGVQASPLGALLARAGGATLDRAGRVVVEAGLSLRANPEVFVIGDLAAFVQDGKPLPGVAPVAMQQGEHVARVIAARARGESPPGPFHYRDRGNLATIGRKAAVAEIRGRLAWGFPAWLLWLFVHLRELIQFESRVLVFVQWAWNYATFSRSARLITGAEAARSAAGARAR